MSWARCTPSPTRARPLRCSAGSCTTWPTWRSPTRPSHCPSCTGSRPEGLHDHRPRGGLMLANQLAALTEPPGVAEALTVIGGFDDALVAGLGRVNDATSTGLAGLAAAVAGSALGGPV